MVPTDTALNFFCQACDIPHAVMSKRLLFCNAVYLHLMASSLPVVLC